MNETMVLCRRYCLVILGVLAATASCGAGATHRSAGSGADSSALTAIQTVTFNVAAGGEAFKCQDFSNPFGQDVAVVETESTMTPGSHHMFVFSDSSIPSRDTNAVTDCSGIEFHDFIHLTQTAAASFTYPAGVGKEVKAANGIRILAHYLNAGSQALNGHVSVNMHWVQPSQIQYLAVGMFLNNLLVFVPPGMSTQSQTFRVPADANVLLAASHMHARGIGFSATTNAGDVIYRGTQWSDPVPQTFAPPLVIKAGASIKWSCTYNNTTGMTLTFGESAAKNEMCILAGIVYPVQAGAQLGTSFQTVF